ncbi:MAG: neutral/alkaline non-lysosomal ceramidase N-terminal domain-containing protein, partial [Chloroflexi bacterium]|nr:neutral/alkaline non-lysosomal ceramidase N-terminal domain-containing protein [Chloroflexota bacterium]
MTRLWAGAARVSITPPLGIAHGGWGAQLHERAEGAEAELFATALVLGDGAGLELVIVDLDLCLLMDDQCDAIRAAVADLTRIPPERVRVSYSHTHAAPVTNVITGGWIRAGRELVEPYLGVLPGLVAGAVRQARGALAPGHVGAGMGECRIGVNRRLALGPNQVVAGHHWDGPVDPTVSVLRIDDENMHPIATVVHYACHPTTAGPDNRLLSPDYPGA